MSERIPWDALAEGYYQGIYTTQGRSSKDARLVIGAVIIKHKRCLSAEETVAQIQENPYMQYFVGLAGYQIVAPFAPSLFVEIRRRMGQGVFEIFQGAIIDALDDVKAKKKSQSQSKPSQSEQPPEDSGDPPTCSAFRLRASLVKTRTVTGSTTFGRSALIPPLPGSTASSW